MNNYILSIEKLKKDYYTKNGEIKAIEDFTFDFLDNEIVAIVGPSGCGKSTLLSIIGN